MTISKTFCYIAIPTTDFNRFLAFYDQITSGLIEQNTNVPIPMAYFMIIRKEIGNLFQPPNFIPCQEGPIVYMWLANELNETVDKIVLASVKNVMPKIQCHQLKVIGRCF